MSVVVIGLNHRTASLDLLERLAVPDNALPKAVHDLCGRRYLSEAVVLSTCNRTEVYAVAERFHAGYHDIREFFCELSGLLPEEFSDSLYVHYDEAAVAHLFEVAAGLDSAVLGESEILGQVGDAWEQAAAEAATGPTLNLLFRHALEVGKRVRTETRIGHGITSVAQAAIAMVTARLGALAGLRVLVVGAGDMGEQLAAGLVGGGVDEILVANRTVEAGRTLADRVGGTAITLSEVPDRLVHTDLLLTSTGAASLVFERSDLEPVLAKRDGRPLLIVDIAVPRDVDAAIGELPGVTLLDMDDLRTFVDVGIKARRREATRARIILDEEIERYLAQATAREVAPLVAALRDRAETMRQAELDRLASRLEGLDERQRRAIEALTRGVLAKLLHEPTVRLKDAAGTSRGDRLAEALRDLFDL